MATIHFAFEGHMEQEALPHLFSRVGKLARNRWRMKWSRRFDGRPDLLKILPGFVRNVCREDHESHVFVLIDYHPADERKRWHDPDSMRQYVCQSVDRGLRDRLHVHLAIHDIESWILAAPGNMANRLGISERLEWQDPEAVDLDRPPKKHIRELFRRHRPKQGYLETRDGVALLEALDKTIVYNRCKGFRDFVDDLARTLSIEPDELIEDGGGK